MNFEQFEEFLLSESCHANHDVSIIDSNGLQHYIKTRDYFEYQILMTKHLVEEKVTIKIEQMENYWHLDDRTAHLFYNPKNGPSFDEHTDPVDIIIECKDGVKTIECNGKHFTLNPGDNLSIPAETLHKALNYEKALMVSYGIGDTETLKRLY